MNHSQILTGKQIIKEFTKNGYMLRPESLDIISQYLRVQPPETQLEYLIKIVNNIKHISKTSANLTTTISNVIEKQAVEESIRLIENLLNNNKNKGNKTTSGNSININNSKPEIQQLATQFANLNQNKNNSLDQLILQKLMNSIIILNPFQDFPYYIFQIDGSMKNENKSQKLSSDVQPKVIQTQKMIENVDQKIQMFINRYNLVKEKLKKSNIYIFHTNLSSHNSKILQQNKNNSNYQMIYDIGTLFGMNDKQEKYTLGIIIQQGSYYYLQDIYQKVKINVSECLPTKGFVTLNQIVLAKGVYRDDTFFIKSIQQPIIHKRKEIVDIFGGLDYFGAYTKVNNLFDKLLALDLEKLQISKEIEEKKIQKINNLSLTSQKHLGVLDLTLNSAIDLSKSQLYSVIIIQNFVMNNPQVLQKFETLLQGLLSLEPLTFIFMGPFFSFQNIQDEADQFEIQQSIDYFLQIVSKFEKFMLTCYWIFVPSVNDIGVNILPRQGLPEILIDQIKSQIPYFINASNPSKISIFGKEFLFSNVDLMKQLRRNSIVNQNDQVSMSQHLIETILGQSHLYPLQIFSKPVFTQHDPSLQLIQLPNYLVFGDKYCEQFYEFLSEQEGNYETAILNPGNFTKSYEFTIVYPLLKKIEKSQVPEFQE